MNVSRAIHHTTVGAVSLIAGPALMSIGDLLHPAETHVAPGIAFARALLRRPVVATT
jgi:hypothetical protein